MREWVGCKSELGAHSLSLFALWPWVNFQHVMTARRPSPDAATQSGISSLQNCEPNKILWFINYPVCDICYNSIIWTKRACLLWYYGKMDGKIFTKFGDVFLVLWHWKYRLFVVQRICIGMGRILGKLREMGRPTWGIEPDSQTWMHGVHTS